MIGYLRIENFKSIKHIEIEPSRINVFIGEPNSGKSNILDALGFLSALGHNPVYLPELVRVKKFSEIYHFKKIENPVVIVTNLGGVIGMYRNFFYFSFVKDSKTSTCAGKDVVNMVVNNLKSEFERRRGIKDREEIIGKINANLHKFNTRLIAEVSTFMDERNNYFKQFSYFGSFRKYIFDKSVFYGSGSSTLPVDYLYPYKGENLFDVV